MSATVARTAITDTKFRNAKPRPRRHGSASYHDVEPRARRLASRASASISTLIGAEPPHRGLVPEDVYDLTEDHLLVTGAPRRGRGGPHPRISGEVERRRCRRGSPLSSLTKIGRTSGGGCRLRAEASRGVLRPSILHLVRAAAPRAPTPAWPPPPASPP